MLSIQQKILSASKYQPDEYSTRLMYSVQNATTVQELFNSFIAHSKSVYARETPGDYLNSCDSEESPLSIFVYELLEPNNISIFNELLSNVQTEEEYNEYKWILDEINTLIWTNPIQYVKNIDIFILHPVIGRHFSFWSGCWVNSCHYYLSGLNKKALDEVYVYCLELYTKIYLHSTSEKKEYYLRLTSDLKFRSIAQDDFPRLYETIRTV